MKSTLDAIFDSDNSDYENSVSISQGEHQDGVVITLSNPKREIEVNRFDLKKALKLIK